jgi:hypothetical protein
VMGCSVAALCRGLRYEGDITLKEVAMAFQLRDAYDWDEDLEAAVTHQVRGPTCSLWPTVTVVPQSWVWCGQLQCSACSQHWTDSVCRAQLACWRKSVCAVELSDAIATVYAPDFTCVRLCGCCLSGEEARGPALQGHQGSGKAHQLLRQQCVSRP